MSVTFEEALSTLQSMFPQWDKETLGDGILPNTASNASKSNNLKVNWYYIQ
jgi:CUE domain